MSRNELHSKMTIFMILQYFYLRLELRLKYSFIAGYCWSRARTILFTMAFVCICVDSASHIHVTGAANIGGACDLSQEWTKARGKEKKGIKKKTFRWWSHFGGNRLQYSRSIRIRTASTLLRFWSENADTPAAYRSRFRNIFDFQNVLYECD